MCCNHDWNNGVRGPAYSMNWDTFVGVTVVTICVVGIVLVVANDSTGVGVADDFLLVPLVNGVGSGLIRILE